MSRKYHRRRGMLSIAEVAICIGLFTMMIAAAISILSISSRITSRSDVQYSSVVEGENFAEKFREDVKSSGSVSISGETLVIAQSGGSIIYSYDAGNTAVCRNGEAVLHDVLGCVFSVEGDDLAEIYTKKANGEGVSYVASR